MNTYTKTIDGKVYYASPNKGTAIIAGNWVSNPTEQMLIGDGWTLVPPHQRTLAEAKQEKIAELTQYDSSSAVNEFLVNGQSAGWLYPADRTNYLNTCQGAQRLGLSVVTFLGYTIPVNSAINALDQINLYAMQCTNVTNSHKNAINAKTTIKQVDNYNFKTGYPEKLNFELANYE